MAASTDCIGAIGPMEAPAALASTQGLTFSPSLFGGAAQGKLYPFLLGGMSAIACPLCGCDGIAVGRGKPA